MSRPVTFGDGLSGKASLRNLHDDMLGEKEQVDSNSRHTPLRGVKKGASRTDLESIELDARNISYGERKSSHSVAKQHRKMHGEAQVCRSTPPIQTLQLLPVIPCPALMPAPVPGRSQRELNAQREQIEHLRLENLRMKNQLLSLQTSAGSEAAKEK